VATLDPVAIATKIYPDLRSVAKEEKWKGPVVMPIIGARVDSTADVNEMINASRDQNSNHLKSLLISPLVLTVDGHSHSRQDFEMKI